jgi:hypothetical protein
MHSDAVAERSDLCTRATPAMNRKRGLSVRRVLRTTILAACLAVSVLAGVGEAAPAPFRAVNSAQALSCNTAQPAFADFEENRVANRVDSSDEPSAHAYVPPSRIPHAIDNAGQHRVDASDRSASRAPPIY